MKLALFFGGLAALVAAAAHAAGTDPLPTHLAATDTVAVRAGTIHVVEGGVVHEGGATLLLRAGRVLAVGADVPIPPDAHVVDYGPGAVIVPGLVAANSTFGSGSASARTADPEVRAIDNFNVHSNYYLGDLAGGVTTVYLAPARNRLIAGQGAVIKLAGEDEGRVLLSSASVQGSVAEDARGVPGYWEPPVPATVDEGLGRAEPQLPGSLMGAMVALRELVAFARGQADHADVYGASTGPALSALMRAGVPWRFEANSEREIRALLSLAASENFPLVVDGGGFSGDLAEEIAAAGVKVVLRVDVAPGRSGRNLGQAEDAEWPAYDNAVRLVEAGVTTAIATPDNLRPGDLRFAAAVASRGGLSSAAALRAITLDAAEVLGVADRVGSLTPGKDADFAVLSGDPVGAGSAVQATWIDGKPVWKAEASESAVVLEVDELHVGDGSVLRPGQVLVRDGRIAEVGSRVAHPAGAVVVHGAAAMPGMIDATGYLGLEGSSKTPATDFKLTRIVTPGDHVDARVALAGVTTVVLAPRGDTKSGTPLMAYKPAGEDPEDMVIADPAALRLLWTDRNRVQSGKTVRDLLAKAAEYDKKWKDYAQAKKAWDARPAPAPSEKKDDDEDDKKGKDDDKDKKKDDDDKKSDSKKKKDEDEAEEPEVDPVAGIWEADVVVPPWTDASHLRLRLEPDGEDVSGSLRCEAVSDGLVELSGTYIDGEVHVQGLGTRGQVKLSGKPKEAEKPKKKKKKKKSKKDDAEEEAPKDKLEAVLTLGDAEVEFTAERTSTELPRASRSAKRSEKKEKVKPPKGAPKQPGVDAKLEPLRRALHGKGTVVVKVDRRDEIRACVAAFEKHGIRPILYGADDAWRMTDELEGRVAGVIFSQTVMVGLPRGGQQSMRNRFAELEAAGIPIAFQSTAEEGAAELPLQAAYAVSKGLSPDGALRALCSGVAEMFDIDDRVGRIAPGLDGDLLLLDGPPLEPGTSVLRAWVNGREVR